VDKALFALLGDYTPAMLDTFYSERGLGVRTASSLTILAAQDRVYTSYSPPNPQLKGGDGGRGGGVGGGGAAQPLIPRSDLRDTAYWAASVHTGADGTATLSFKLPDDATTWQVTVKAMTADTKVGEASNAILVTKPLLVRPILPRFLRPGDTASVGATIHNSTAAPLDVDVSLAITGSSFLSTTGVISSANGSLTAVQHIAVAAGGETEALWAVRASTTARAGFTITARGSDGSGDAVGVDIPINPIAVPEVTAQSGVIEPGQGFVQNVFIPYSVIPTIGQLVVHLSASLASSALDGLQYNLNFLYDCTEQTVSRFLPLLYVEDAFKAAGQKSPYSDQLPALVSRSLARLYALQHGSGGWGYWEESSGSPDYPYMTALAVEGLLKARADGFSVDQSALQRGIGYLERRLAANNEQDGANFSDIRDPSTRAYVLDVLAMAGDAAATTPLAQLAADQSKLTVFGQAHLVLGLVHSGQQAAAAKAIEPLVGGVKLQGSATAHWQADPAYAYYYINMESDDRATALAVQAILAVNPTDELAPKAVLWLMQHRSAGGHWASTQETTQATIALARYVAARHELAANFAYSTTFNGATLGSGKFDPTNLSDVTALTAQVEDMLINQPNLLQISRDQGSGPLYYNATLSYFVPSAGISAYDNGLSISRSYLPADGAAKDQPAVITATTAGSLIHVRLLLNVPQDSYYVTIEDPLPAGMEAVNPGLATTSSAAQTSAACPSSTPDPNTGSYTQCRAYDGVELHDDRVTYFATYLHAGSYEFDYVMRATTPGSYTALPARAYLMYSPETWGRSDGGLITIRLASAA
jgi:alpha-2-macroglobulin